METYLLTIFSVLWIDFLISRCECPEVNEVDEIIAKRPVEEEDYKFECEKIIKTPPRSFKVETRGYNLQADLGYLGKPLWPSQWIMTEEFFRVKNRIYGPTMRIAEMHRMNYKGEGVGVVIIANSPINCKHELIQTRCKNEKADGYSLYPKKSFFSFNRSKKYPKCSPQSLASAIAGIIGMTDEGVKGGVGIAPKCTLGNIVIEPSSSNGSPENSSFKMISNTAVALFVHAWQLPQFDTRNEILLHWGKFEYMNFGRELYQLKPHVMGAGDLGSIGNSCQTNEYTSADSSFVFGSVGYNGYLTSYSETCASLIGVTYSTTNKHEFYNDIVTIPSSSPDFTTIAPKSTSIVSAGVAGGIVALIIDCYKKWHHGESPSVNDLAFILAFSANPDALQNKNMLWFRNAVGVKFSPHGGFGLPNLKRAFELIYMWPSLGIPRIYTCNHTDKMIQFKCVTENGRTSSTYTSNLICRFSIHNIPANLYIQTVTVEISAKLIKRGSMTAYMTSPGGTVSCLFEGRPYDTSQGNYKRLRLRSYHFIGENLPGQWKISIFTYKENSKPSFLPVYTSKARAQNAAPSPIGPSPPGNPNNPVAAVSPGPVPPVAAQGSPLPEHSRNQPQTASQPVMGSAQGQQSEIQGQQSQVPTPSSSAQAASQPATDSLQNQQGPVTTPSSSFQTTSQPAVGSTPGHQSQVTTPASALPQKPVTSPPDPSVGKKVKDPNPHFSTKPSAGSARRSRERTVNKVTGMSFRFLLVENLPLDQLKLEPAPKDADRTAFEFELLKLWADFRQYLLVQTDPQNYGTGTHELKHVYGITNVFIKKLLAIQDDDSIRSVASLPLDVLRDLSITDDSPHHPPLQHSDSLAREGVHPFVSPPRVQNRGAPLPAPGKPHLYFREGRYILLLLMVCISLSTS